MATPVWRVEFDRAAARDLRKLGIDAERRVLRYLRERIAGSSDPRRMAARSPATAKGFGGTAWAITASSPLSRTTASWCWS
jgi:hypothetical protein